MTDLFSTENNQNTIDTSNVTLDTLVGENQKYKDPDALAKAYVHADAALDRLKADMVAREAEIKVLKDLDTARQDRSNDQSNQNQRQQTPPVVDDQSKPNEEKDLSKLVREELERTNQEQTAANNINTVSEKLASFYGSGEKARDAVQKRAAELKVSVQFLMDVAAKSPVAFYNTIGFKEQNSSSTPAAGSDVNTAAFGNQSSQRNFKYWEDMRKADPKMYYSVQMRKQMFEDARELGGNFYK